MRVEKHHGQWLLCGHILPVRHIQPGQTWAGVGGITVSVPGVRDGWVCYTWREGDKQMYHEKEAFAF